MQFFTSAPISHGECLTRPPEPLIFFGSLCADLSWTPNDLKLSQCFALAYRKWALSGVVYTRHEHVHQCKLQRQIDKW